MKTHGFDKEASEERLLSLHRSLIVGMLEPLVPAPSRSNIFSGRFGKICSQTFKYVSTHLW